MPGGVTQTYDIRKNEATVPTIRTRKSNMMLKPLKTVAGFASADSTGWIGLAAVSGTVSVLVSASAPHLVNPVLEFNALDCLMTGSLYGALHALAILGVVALSGAGHLNRRFAVMVQWLFLTGIILFPGALYGLAMHSPRWFGAIAPLGAVSLVLGWVTLIMALVTHRGYANPR